jgi:hypothetical protein
MFCPNPDCPHAIRTGEPAEYQVGIVACAECDSVLVENPPPSDAVDYEELVPVREISNAALVPLVKSLLDPTGMRYFIKGEGVQDLLGLGRFPSGFNVITGPPVVYVEPDRAEEARELLSDLSDSPEHGDEPPEPPDDDGPDPALPPNPHLDLDEDQ